MRRPRRPWRRIAHLLEGEESEGALIQIADTSEDMAGILDTTLDIENEECLAYQVWRLPRAPESISGRSYSG